MTTVGEGVAEIVGAGDGVVTAGAGVATEGADVAGMGDAEGTEDEGVAAVGMGVVMGSTVGVLAGGVAAVGTAVGRKQKRGLFSMS